MRKWMPLLLCLMLLAAPALAEEADAPALSLTPGEVTGDFDEPAPENPEARYTDYFVENTDGSEYLLFVMLDSCNDEAEDIKDGGALYITENVLSGDGNPPIPVSIVIQQSPYGTMMIAIVESAGIEYVTYNCGAYTFGQHTVDGETSAPERMDGQYTDEEFEYYTTSYHFPYGRLECLQGVRQDENGYAYFFIKSDEDISFEFVTGENMRILQLRMYVRDGDGVLRLNNYVDYETGPAREIPQAVLDAFGGVMEPAPEANADENGDNPAE